MAQILVVGDLHLGGSLSLGKQSVGAAFNSRVIDQFNLLDWIYEQASNRNIQHIVLTGDVFDDPRPLHAIIIAFIDWLNKCSAYDMSVHIIAGNHDILRSGQNVISPLDIITAADIEDVFIYKKINTVHLDDMGITFVPFRDRRSFDTDLNSKALATIGNQIAYECNGISNTSTKVLLGHLALEGAIPVGFELGELSNELHCPLSMFQGYDYTLMGHVHKFQIMSKDPVIGHIGSLDISDFGEAGHKKYLAIVDSKSDIEYIEVPTRPLRSITLTLPAEVDNAKFIEDALMQTNGIDRAIVKLSIILPTNSLLAIDKSYFEKLLLKLGAFYVSKISEERTFVSVKKQMAEKLDNAVNEISAIKTYASMIDEGIRDEFITTASNIVQEFKETTK